MNDQANAQLVKQAYQLFKAGDIASFLNLLTENVLWVLPEMANVPFAGTWKGRQQVRQFFGRLNELQEVVEFEPEEFIAQGGKVIVLGRFTMHVRATDKTSRSDWVHVWTVEGDRASAVREYVDTLAISRAHELGPPG